MSTYQLSVPVEIDDRFVLDVIDAAGYGIGYWARSAVVDAEAKTYTVTESDPQEGNGVHVLTFELLAVAMIELASDGWKDIRDGLAENDAGMIDSSAADVIVQQAAFSEIVYG